MRTPWLLASRWLLVAVLCVLAPSLAAAQGTHDGQGKTHPTLPSSGHRHAKPAPHAKVQAKKKRPAVPKKKAVAKHSKSTQRAKRSQLGPRVLPKPNHETLTPVRRVPPPTPVASKPSPQNQTLEASSSEPAPRAVVAPEAPTPPVAPEVPAPKDVASKDVASSGASE